MCKYTYSSIVIQKLQEKLLLLKLNINVSIATYKCFFKVYELLKTGKSLFLLISTTTLFNPKNIFQESSILSIPFSLPIHFSNLEY